MANAVKIDGARKLKENIPNPDRREDKIGRILTKLSKFAVDSAVNDSLQLKGVTGRKMVHKIVQEELKDQPPLLSSNDKKKQEDFKLVEMQAKIGEMLEDINIVKQQNMTSAKSAEGSKPVKKIPNDGIKGLDLTQTNRKKVFIRSRL